MGRRPPAAATRVNLIRVMDLLQTHITSALCQTVFRRVRRTERQRAWTLQALVQFWTAVILRAPEALSQALVDTIDQREPMFPRIVATPEAFFQRCRDLRPAFFAEVFGRFTARLVEVVPPRYAAGVAPVRARFTDILLLDGSRLAAIAHRLKLLWRERAVVLPGCLLGVYDLGRGLCRQLHLSLHRLQRLSKRRHGGGCLEDWLVRAGSGVSAPPQLVRYIRWRAGGTRYELLTNVLAPARLAAAEALALYPYR